MADFKRAVAIGFFDGVHIGHAALLEKTKQRAAGSGAVPSVVSFDVHPDNLVFGGEVKLINSAVGREDLRITLQLGGNVRRDLVVRACVLRSVLLRRVRFGRLDRLPIGGIVRQIDVAGRCALVGVDAVRRLGRAGRGP